MKAKAKLRPCSACCNSPVTIEGRTTMFYRCSKCGQPCDVSASRRVKEGKCEK